jgi:outer membrane receptor for ferrienterochelin and colicins
VNDTQNNPILFCTVGLLNTHFIATTNAFGYFELKQVPKGEYTVVTNVFGYESKKNVVFVDEKLPHVLSIHLQSSEKRLDEVVITGTMKEVSKDESPVNIDIITPKLFQKTATPNLFEATGMVTGVKPQINCNVCNTGDIHINGMEGPYTLILIDGMPIVSGLSSVYGLMGIPASMIERLEVAKGPSGALYGSEAMGGTINLITKNPATAPKMYVDYYGTSYLENNLDWSTKLKVRKKVNWLIGSNIYFFNDKVDKNKDGFTDVTLQKRISLFNKLNFERRDNREFSIAARYVWEDRWGGQLNWNKNFRGGDSIYGESIYTQRAEFISKYEWPLKEKVITQVSYNFHDQNSVYGRTPFLAKQSTGFAQTYWTKQISRRNDLLAGINVKNVWYDDNTAVTQTGDGKKNRADNTTSTGFFLQNETTFDSLAKHKLLSGLRMDYNNVFGFIPSPRLAYKWSPFYKFIFRANFGTGFRIVNVFTEDHASLTGAREVVFINKIKPEKSYNGSLNVVYKMKVTKASMIIWDLSLFYYYFTNKIYGDYDSDPNKVIYNNLNGYAFSRGCSVNASLASPGNFKFNTGIIYTDVQNVNRDSLGNLVTKQQLHAPKWSGNFVCSYTFPKQQVKIDLTGNFSGPQRLPILPKDYRPEYSPWFCLVHLQFSKTIKQNTEIYFGIKNLLNFVPQNPIMRPQDPFDKKVNDPIANPNGYTFDPSYNYAPIQGIRTYVGVRWTLH